MMKFKSFGINRMRIPAISATIGARLKLICMANSVWAGMLARPFIEIISRRFRASYRCPTITEFPPQSTARTVEPSCLTPGDRAFASTIIVLGVDLTHGEVANKSNQQQTAHDVHGDRIGLRLRHAAVDLILANVVDQHGTQDTGHRPRRQQPPMDGAHLKGAEDVAQVRRDGG